MVQKVGELSWFERMTKEFENDPEYLREYIMLCSSQIKDQETKIAALEQRFDALSTKFSAMVEENAALKRERDELKEENETLRCHAHDAELAFERNAELKAENVTLRKRLEPIDSHELALEAASLNCDKEKEPERYFNRIMGIDTFVALLKNEMEQKEG